MQELRAKLRLELKSMDSANVLFTEHLTRVVDRSFSVWGFPYVLCNTPQGFTVKDIIDENMEMISQSVLPFSMF